jgi:hypothetical protein
VVGILVVLVAGACSAAGSTGGQGVGGTTTDGQAADAATFAVSAPSDGATVTLPFEIRFDSSQPLGAPETGDHHVHVYFDTDTSAADYDIVYGTSEQVTRPLAPGQHTLIAALANPDHSLAGPTSAITITVGGGGTAGSGTTQATPSATQPGYDY